MKRNKFPKRKLTRTRYPPKLTKIQQLLVEIRIAQKEGLREKALILDKELAKLQRIEINKLKQQKLSR